MANAPVPLVSNHSRFKSNVSDLFGDVAMGFLNAIPGLGQALAKLVGDHHAAMVSAGAAEGNSEIALPFLNVMRQEVDQEIGNTLDELLGLRERPDVARYAGVLPAEFLERGNVVGVGQETNIEHQVAIRGNSVPIPETGDLYQDASRTGALAAKGRVDGLAQLMHVELAGVDNGRGQRANGLQALPLPADAGGDALP